MPIRVKCGNCKKILGVKDEHAGKRIKCPVCQNVVAVPLTTGQNGSPAPAPGNGVAKKPATELKKDSAEVKKPVVPPPPPSPESTGPPPQHADDEALSVFAEDLAPKEADEGPKTIDFRCEWCDEEVHLPLEMAGKQTQCPNVECRRIVKVPMPKIEAKRDWKKMDRRGPAAALVNQPEQLENAWGTQEATRARQASLAQAGAIKLPPKPRIGAAGWIMRVSYGLGAIVIVAAGIFGAVRLRDANEQKDVIAVLLKLDVSDPVCRAQKNRVISMYYLRSSEGKVRSAQSYFSAAQSLISNIQEPSVNEQLFLGELAQSQLEMGGSADTALLEMELIRKAKLSWEDVQSEIKPTLLAIKDPDCQVMATRDILTQLLAKKQEPIAVGLVASLSPEGDNASILSQKIALDFLRGDDGTTKNAETLLAGGQVDEPWFLVGCTEGYARKGEYDNAFTIVKNEKLDSDDRLYACVGTAAIALDTGNKVEAAKFVKEAVRLGTTKESQSQWLMLHLAKLAARSLDPIAEKDEWDRAIILKDKLEGPFKLRAELEIFLVKCDKAAGPVDPKEMEPIETLAKELDKNESATLSLAWFALAQQHARQGQKRPQVQQALTNRPPEDMVILEKIRPMVDVGWYLGALQ